MKQSSQIIDMEKPTNYPFPDDNILWTSARSDFDPHSDSYVALAELPDTHKVEINGRSHRNTHRLVIHSPTRGPVSFLTTEADAFSLISAGLLLLAPSETAHGGKGVAKINANLFNRKLPVEVDFTPLDS